MAKKSGSIRHRTSTSSKAKSPVNRIKEVKQLKTKFLSGKFPLPLYFAGGIAAILVARFGYRYYQNHPEIKDYLKENFDTVENKFREYRDSSSEARH